MKSFKLLFLLLLGSLYVSAQQIELESYASGFSNPVAIEHAGDARLFIIERAGRIRIIDENGATLSTPFLDITSKVDDNPNERGLLGLAFHPDYANNGIFFINYTRNGGDTQVARYSVDAANPNVADASSEEILMTIDQPFWNHNGGHLAFGPDGYLYIGTGDGGSGGDPDNNSQNRQELLGKMLRIDIDNGMPYGIPANNPFVGDDTTLDEIWAIGLRNPWRYSFDRATGDLWIGDVGQQVWEEITLQPANSTGGENYGWRCYEGTNSYNTGGCGPATDYVDPIYEYSHSGGHCSVTGGFMYRGCDFPDLYGYYIYADYCSGRFWSLVSDGAGGWTNQVAANYAGFDISTFGEDVDGELYVARVSQGRIYRVKSANAPDFTITEDMGTLTAPAGFSNYQWYLNNVLITDATDTEYTPLESGDITVTFDGENSCSYTSELLPFIFVVSAKELSTVEQLSISPNPFSSVLEVQIEVNTPTSINLQVLNMQGQRMVDEQLQVNDVMQKQLKLKDLPSGVYFVTIATEEGKMVQKVVKN